MELISERDVARRLAVYGLSRSATHHLLSTGLAGEPLKVAGAHLYDAAAIDHLAAREPVSEKECWELFPDGALVARLPRHRTIDAGDEWPATAQVLAGPWPVDTKPWVTVYCWHKYGRMVPLLLSVAGCVLSGATTTGIRAATGDGSAGLTCFDLAPPGAWLEQVRGRMLLVGRGVPVERLGVLATFGPDRAARKAERARR